MGTLTEPRHAGGYLVSEANGSRSRESVIFAAGHAVPAGAVLGRVTATGKYVPVSPAAEDGSEKAAGISHAAVDATDADAPGVITARDAEVNAAELEWPTGTTTQQIADALAELAEAGIIAR
ncbi:head decoration protein [Telmatospirillum sp. J64-1]|uniref:head decoration protein n=1 Tax=Telmatospirillum sp. J64-1 TaxID=2502183 RepID=UPI00115D03E5|nr:head decoration protein [Telmatospirillum sp. J64-1]